MDLLLNRIWFSDKSTTGTLKIDGEMECYTLEDVDRGLEKGGNKIAGETAIPRGKYRTIIDFSRRFQRPLPRLLNVPHFEGVRIHAGNRSNDTEGCILVGRVHLVDYVGESKITLESLMLKILNAIDKKEEVWFTVA